MSNREELLDAVFSIFQAECGVSWQLYKVSSGKTPTPSQKWKAPNGTLWIDDVRFDTHNGEVRRIVVAKLSLPLAGVALTVVRNSPDTYDDVFTRELVLPSVLETSRLCLEALARRDSVA
jgi:hypothetical protein